MERKYLNAKVIDILSMAPRDNVVIQVYLTVEYLKDDILCKNAIHLAKILKYEFDGIHMMTQEVCDKALKKIPKEVRVTIKKDGYCILEHMYLKQIKDAFKYALYQ